jgi:hypothetical protein
MPNPQPYQNKTNKSTLPLLIFLDKQARLLYTFTMMKEANNERGPKMEGQTQNPWEGTPVIDSYSRAQAIEDGVLVDVSSVAREAGIKFPVAMTRTVWAKYVEVPEGVICQDESGRLWDILWMFRSQASRGGDTLLFKLHIRNDNLALSLHGDLVTLKAVCGPGDTPEPVVTIMLPEED